MSLCSDGERPTLALGVEARVCILASLTSGTRCVIHLSPKGTVTTATPTDDLAAAANLAAATNPESPMTPRGFECAICLHSVCRSCTGACSHHFCAACMLQWCSSSGECPKCRAPIDALRLDAEFDSLLGATGRAGRGREDLRDYTVALRLGAGRHAGLTLKNMKDGPGVLVTTAVKKDAGYCAGLREGDRIVWMNGVPSHSSSGGSSSCV